MSETASDTKVDQPANDSSNVATEEGEKESGDAQATGVKREGENEGVPSVTKKPKGSTESSKQPARESKTAATRRLSSLEVAAREGEAFLKELGHKDTNEADTGRRRTRSQTRPAQPAPPPAKQKKQETPRQSKSTRGRKKQAAKQEQEEESEEATAEDNNAKEDSGDTEKQNDAEGHTEERKDKVDEKKEVNNKEEKSGEAPSAGTDVQEATTKVPAVTPASTTSPEEVAA